MNNFDVICIGAALIDIIAQVDRHPLEDDEVFVSKLLMLYGGAAANTAVACSKLGLTTSFIGKLGFDDEYGNKILSEFLNEGVNTDLIKYSKDHQSGSTYIALDKNADRRIYAYSGAADYLSEKDIIEDELIKSKVLFLSSLKNINPFIKAGKIGKKNKIPVILNPGMLIIDQGFHNIKLLLEKIDLLILSEKEYCKLIDIEDIPNNTNHLINKNEKFWELGLKTIIITLGKKGALLLSKNRSFLVESIIIENVKDTTGAGDAFSAGFIYSFFQNLSFEFDNLVNNVRLGNYVAGKCIQELGARKGIPIKEDIAHYLRNINKKV